MNDRGFSLVETLLAVSIVVLALATMAQLLAMSARANAEARQATLATVLAGQKMEQLRSTSDQWPPTASGSLRQNVEGHCDFLDEYGRLLAAGTVAPLGTAYVRRWSIEPMPVGAAGAFVVQVVVRPPRGKAAAVGRGEGEDDARLLGGAHLVTMKAREVG